MQFQGVTDKSLFEEGVSFFLCQLLELFSVEFNIHGYFPSASEIFLFTSSVL